MHRFDISLVGSRIQQFYFERLLGHGGSASVYLAQQLGTNGVPVRQVAIKSVIEAKSDRDSLREIDRLYSKDIRCLSMLSEESPIVTYHHSFVSDLFQTTNGTYSDEEPSEVLDSIEELCAFFIVMEYADGGSLDDPRYRETVIQRSEEAEHLVHFKDICVALKSAHNSGIIHRDVKPANLFYFREQNRLKLGDFGIAEFTEDQISQSDGSVAGTIPYLSPEVFEELRCTQKSDIYALGCTLYELFTGDKAFHVTKNDLSELDGHSTDLLNAYRKKHNFDERPDAFSAGARISVSLSGVLKRAMSIDPGNRPSLDELIEAIEQLRTSQTASVPVSLPDVDDRELPVEPQLLSKYIVHPGFRRAQLSEMAYWVLVPLRARTPELVKTLIGVVAEFFGDTFSLYEVFGDHAFAVRVWTSPRSNRLPRMVQALSSLISDYDQEKIVVMACEDIRYLHGSMSPPIKEDLSVADALVRIGDHQEYDTQDSARWLKKANVYVGKPLTPLKTQAVKCFCFVTSLSSMTDEDERSVQTAILIDAINRSGLDARKLEIALFRKAFKHMEGFANEVSDHLITYTAPSFKEVIHIPGAIMERVPGNKFKTSTTLCTGRYIIESHRVNCDAVEMQGSINSKAARSEQTTASL